MKQPNYGWMVPGFGFVCYENMTAPWGATVEVYGLFTFGGQFVRHLPLAEVLSLHSQKSGLRGLSKATKVKAHYPVPEPDDFHALWYDKV